MYHVQGYYLTRGAYLTTAHANADVFPAVASLRSQDNLTMALCKSLAKIVPQIAHGKLTTEQQCFCERHNSS